MVAAALQAMGCMSEVVSGKDGVADAGPIARRTRCWEGGIWADLDGLGHVCDGRECRRIVDIQAALDRCLDRHGVGFDGGGVLI